MTGGSGLAGTRAQLALLAVLFVALAVLLQLSSRTGQAQFDADRARLDAIEVFNLRLDGAMFPLMFDLRTDFDELAQLEGELAGATRAYREQIGGEGAQRLASMIDRKLELVDRFKSRQAVLRNSANIASQTVEAMDARAAGEAAHVTAAVQRALLGFLARRDPPSAEALAQAVASVPDDHRVAADPDWAVMVAHVERMLAETVVMGELLMETYSLPVLQAVLDEHAVLAGRMGEAAATASGYRIAAFAVAVLLILFSSLKVLEIRRYVRLVEAANDELEHRVGERTAELAGANDALRREMSEREGVEARLRIAERLETVGQLAAGVAHEINTPVQYISDNLEFVASAWDTVWPLLERGAHDPMDVGEDACRRACAADAIDSADAIDAAGAAGAGPARAGALRATVDLAYLREQLPRALAQARTGLRRVSGIVRALEEFSRPPGGAGSETDLNRAVANAITVTRCEWKYVAEVDLQLDPDLPPVPCDGAAINQVLLNLLVNAVHALAACKDGAGRGTILVETARVGDAVEIRVEDSGPGVNNAIMDRIFDPWFTTRDVGEGRGHGLAIAHRIVEAQHGGRLSVGESRLGGACFTVRLPLHEPLKVAS